MYVYMCIGIVYSIADILLLTSHTLINPYAFTHSYTCAQTSAIGIVITARAHIYIYSISFFLVLPPLHTHTHADIHYY